MPQMPLTKINTDSICYTILVTVNNPATGLDEEKKWGCAHKGPNGTQESWDTRETYYRCENLYPDGADREKCRDIAFALDTNRNRTLLIKMQQLILSVRTFKPLITHTK